MRDVHFEHLNAEGAPQAAQAAYPARILGASGPEVFDSNEGCADSRSLLARRVSTRRPFPHDVSGHARDPYPRAGVRGGSRRASRDVTGTADRRRDAIVVHRETSPVYIGRSSVVVCERGAVTDATVRRTISRVTFSRTAFKKIGAAPKGLVTNTTARLVLSGERREPQRTEKHERTTKPSTSGPRNRPIPIRERNRSAFGGRVARLAHASTMVTSTSTPGSMEMEVICLTTSAGECRSIRRLWMRSW